MSFLGFKYQAIYSSREVVSNVLNYMFALTKQAVLSANSILSVRYRTPVPPRVSKMPLTAGH